MAALIDPHPVHDVAMGNFLPRAARRAGEGTRYACAMALATVRRAVDADVDALVRIQSDTWRAAYAGLVPAEALAHLSTPAARAAWQAAVGAGGGHHVFVATEGEWTVGFCAAAYYGGEDGAAAAEITTLLVEPRWGRRGHGGRLLAAAADALRCHGARAGWAWIPEEEDVSRAL